MDENEPLLGKNVGIQVGPTPAAAHSAGNDHEGDFVTENENRDLSRGLQQRHVSLIAIAGAIGTGLFLGLGSSIQTAGPAGALLGYVTVGLIVCAVQFALGEVTALLPVTGSFVRHAEFLVDPAMGFAIGWNIVRFSICPWKSLGAALIFVQVYGNWLSIPAEISAICVLFEFWTDINPSVWIILVIVMTFLVGMSYVHVYGEVEFWFALLKIFFIVFLIVLGLVIDLGGVSGIPHRGFQYWNEPGAFVEYIGPGPWGNFLGYWAVMASAVFSFAGTESVAMAAAETRAPRQVIPRACKRVFWRVALFYGFSVLVVGLLVASDDPHLDDESGTAAQSPFVIAANAAGISAIPSLVNAVVITSAWSSSNQALLSGTRVLYGLALKGQAPKTLLRTTSWGVPYVCVLVQTTFMFSAFMTLSSGALTVFWWFVDLTACGVLVSWISILINHQRLMLAMNKQDIPLSSLPWHNSWTKFSTPVALFMCIVILLTSGFTVFTKGNWSTSGFVSSYLDIPLVLTAYTLWKLIKRTKTVDLSDVPLKQVLDDIKQNPEPIEPSPKGLSKFVGFLWD